MCTPGDIFSNLQVFVGCQPWSWFEERIGLGNPNGSALDAL